MIVNIINFILFIASVKMIWDNAYGIFRFVFYMLLLVIFIMFLAVTFPYIPIVLSAALSPNVSEFIFLFFTLSIIFTYLIERYKQWKEKADNETFNENLHNSLIKTIKSIGAASFYSLSFVVMWLAFICGYSNFIH